VAGGAVAIDDRSDVLVEGRCDAEGGLRCRGKHRREEEGWLDSHETVMPKRQRHASAFGEWEVGDDRVQFFTAVTDRGCVQRTRRTGLYTERCDCGVRPSPAAARWMRRKSWISADELEPPFGTLAGRRTKSFMKTVALGCLLVAAPEDGRIPSVSLAKEGSAAAGRGRHSRGPNAAGGRYLFLRELDGPSHR
jgi:hypothetical protein